MNKIISIVIIFFLISGSFFVVFSPVSAAGVVEDSWNSKTSMSHARLALGVVAVGDKIYAIGGYGADGWVSVNECYDPKTDSWVTLTSMPTPRADFAIVAYQGKIYCMGGTVPGAVCSVNEVYDVATDSWSTKASLPVAMGHIQACVMGEKIFVFARSSGSLFMYDPIADLWVEKTGVPIRDAASMFSVVMNNTFLVIGDFSYHVEPRISSHSTPSFSPVEQRVMIYDPITDVWQRRGYSIPDEWIYYTVAEVTTGLYAPENIYIFKDSELTVYDPINNVWSTAESVPASRSQFGVAVIDDVFYVIGGSIYDNGMSHALSLNEQYVPIGYSGPLLSEPLNNIVIVAVVALTLIVGILVIVLFYCLRKRGKN